MAKPAAPRKARSTVWTPLSELPGELRYRLAGYTRVPDDLEHAAGALRDALESIAGDSAGAELRAASARLMANAAHAQALLVRVAAFAGEVHAFAWAADARDTAADADE
jgi:acetyl esterase/lipase